MPRTNKRIAHHVGYDRDMKLIFGKPDEKKISAPAGGVGPSDGMIDKLMERRRKFSLGRADKPPKGITGVRG